MKQIKTLFFSFLIFCFSTLLFHCHIEETKSTPLDCHICQIQHQTVSEVNADILLNTTAIHCNLVLSNYPAYLSNQSVCFKVRPPPFSS